MKSVIPSYDGFAEAVTLQRLVIGIAADVVDEIKRARALHGPQKHLDLVNPHADHAVLAADCKRGYDELVAAGAPSWDAITLEEVYEFFEAIQAGDKEAARAEGIQAIAMIASMIELL